MVIRPIDAGDRQALNAGFERMGRESRYRRFLTATPALSEAQLRYLTEVDQHHHVALAAVDGSNIVGVARFVREGIADAELAIGVVDEWQGRGLGTALMAALVDQSLKQGVTRFQAYVLADNEPMLRLLAGLGHQRWSGTGPERRITIDPAGPVLLPRHASE